MPQRTVRIDPARLRALRNIRGFRTQKSLADASGVDVATISRMDRMIGPFEVVKVEAVAKALRIDDLRLLGVPDQDAAALEEEASLRAKMERLLGLRDGDSRPAGRKRRPIVRDAAPA